MLTLEYNRLTWGEEDAFAMARVLGSDHAVKGWAPALPSITKAALARGVLVDATAREHLDQARRLRRELRALRKLEDAVLIDAFADRLFPHQRGDLAYFDKARLPAFLLGHQPGVGKTAVAIRWAQRTESKRILVICPNSAKRQWRREIRRWWHGKPRPLITIVEGTIAEQVAAASTPHGWVIGHWESLVHARDGYLEHQWDLAVLDEAHKMQNREAKRTLTAFDLDAALRLALTGHPFASTPDQLWPILHWLYPQTYSSFWRYFGQHVKATPKTFGGFSIEGVRDGKLLRWEIAPFMLRRTKREVFKSLPTLTRVERVVSLPSKARAEYDRLRKQFFVELRAEHKDEKGKVLAIPSVLARTMRLRQFLVDPALIGSATKSVKYPEALELIEELDNPLVIFTSFRQAAIRLQAFLKAAGKTTGIISGGMKSGDLERTRRRFLAGDLHAAILVTAAAEESLNFGKYGYVAHLDLPWTPKGLEQTEGRVDRPEEGTGKLVPTTAWRILVENSYEQKMEAKLEGKYSQFKSVFTVDGLEELFG